MDLNQIYTELIREHNKNPINKIKMLDATISEKGHNPSCGDEIILHLKVKEDTIVDASFSGIGCAISQASTSMMIDLIRGKKIDEAEKIVDIFLKMIRKEIDNKEELEKLGDAIFLKNISNMPARVKCGVLSWHTLKIALEKVKEDN